MSEFYFLMGKAGFKNEQELAKHLECSIRSIKNWRRSDKPPKAVFLYLKLRAGEMNEISEEWKEHRILNDCIINKDGSFIYHWELNAMKYLYKRANVERWRLERALNIKAHSPCTQVPPILQGAN